MTQENDLERRKTPLFKLDIVLSELKKNPNVYLAGMVINPNHGYGWTEAVSIFVAPIKPTYKIDKLNHFMKGLIKDVKATCLDEACLYMEDGIHLGRLYYDEDICKIKSVIQSSIEAIDPDALSRSGLKVGSTTRNTEEILRRRTWVRVYPDVNSAQTIFQYEKGVEEGHIEPNNNLGYSEHWLTGEQIRKLKQGQNPLSRISGLLRGK